MLNPAWLEITYFKTVVRVLPLLVVVMMASGCSRRVYVALSPQWRECKDVFSQPRIGSLQIYGEGAWARKSEWIQHQTSEHPRRPRRSAIPGRGGLVGVGIFAEGGIRVGDTTRGGWFQRSWRCEQLSTEELATAVVALERLASVLPAARPPPGELRELLMVDRARDDSMRWWVAVDDLSPEAVEAVRSLVCLAHEKLVKWTDRAIETVGPQLRARLDFPATCTSTVSREE